MRERYMKVKRHGKSESHCTVRRKEKHDSVVGTSHMNDIRQTSVAKQRLVGIISVATNKRNKEGTVASSVYFRSASDLYKVGTGV
jgi:hypothetical protein